MCTGVLPCLARSMMTSPLMLACLFWEEGGGRRGKERAVLMAAWPALVKAGHLLN